MLCFGIPPLRIKVHIKHPSRDIKGFLEVFRLLCTLLSCICEWNTSVIRLNRLSPHVLPFRFHLLASIRARSIKEIPGGEMQTGVLEMHL